MPTIKWIKCSKRLPRKAQIVLVTDGYQVGLGFLGYDESLKSRLRPSTTQIGYYGFVRPVSLDILPNIIAWAPVPKPPKYKR